MDAARKMYETFDEDFACLDGQMGIAACHVLNGDFDQAFTCWEKASKDGNLPARRNMDATLSLKERGGRIIGFKSIADITYY